MIKKQGKYYIDTENWGTSLGIDSSNLKGCIEEYHNSTSFSGRTKFNGLFGHESFGFKEINLDFLTHFKTLNHIWFWNVNLEDIQGVYSFREFESFGILGKRPPINFSKFSQIKVLTIDWTNKDTNLSGLKSLEEFYLWHHKPKEKNFEDFKFPSYCSNKVQLNWTNVETLESLNGLIGTKSLEIHRSRNLRSLRGIEKLSDSLEELIIRACGKLIEIQPGLDLPNLKRIHINGKNYK
ncbi:MAG: hypothetical protein R3B93_10845 [Bacteroidia bacterium]